MSIRTVRLRVYPGPAEGAAEIAATLAAVRRYKNKLTEIQRDHRKKYQTLRSQAFPAFAAAEAAYQQAADELEALKEQTKAARAKARKGEKAPPELAAAKQKAKEAAARLKAERDQIDPAALRAVTAHLQGEEEAAVKAATAESGLTAPTAYEARQDLQRAKKTAGPEGPRFRRHDGGGTVAVQVPAVDQSERILQEALRQADLHPSASKVLREGGRIALDMGKPRFVGLVSYECPGCQGLEPQGRKTPCPACGSKEPPRRHFVTEDKAYAAAQGKGDLLEGLTVWAKGQEGSFYRGREGAEPERLQVLSQLAPLRTWSDFLTGKIRDASLRFLPRLAWRAAWPKGRGDWPSQQLPDPESKRTARFAWGLVTFRANRDGHKAIIPILEPPDRLPCLDAQVKQVELHVRRLGIGGTDGKPRFRYAILVTVDDPTPAPGKGPGVVAVNVGWRPRPDGSVRVGYYVGDNGEHGEIAVPKELLESLQHAESLQGIRDRLFDLAKARLGQYLATLTEPPAWLTEGTEHLAKWRGGGRLERLLAVWRDNRIPGDEDVFRELAGPKRNAAGQDEAWLPKYWHLLAWEQNARRKALARRKLLFQYWGKRLGERYGTLLLEDFDLSAERRKPTVEEGTQKERTPLVKLMNAAAPGELRTWLAMAQERRGGEVVRETLPLATQRCAHCGYEGRWDAAESVVHTCRSCGQQVDQDWQNCQNRLRDFQARRPVAPAAAASAAPAADLAPPG